MALVDEGKFLFIEEFQLINAERMIGSEMHHFTTSNEIIDSDKHLQRKKLLHGRLTRNFPKRESGCCHPNPPAILAIFSKRKEG